MFDFSLILINFSVTSVYALENDNIELYNSTDISTESDNQTDIDKNSINQITQTPYLVRLVQKAKESEHYPRIR